MKSESSLSDVCGMIFVTNCSRAEQHSAVSLRGCGAIRALIGPVFLIGLLSVAVLGCQPQRAGPATQPTQQETPYLDHIVQFQGETLSIIASWYTGSGRNWELVLDANPGVDPRRIRIGDLIRIPRELLSREDPLPRSAVPGAGAARAASASTGRASAGMGSSRDETSMGRTDGESHIEESDAPFADSSSDSAGEDSGVDSSGTVPAALESETAEVQELDQDSQGGAAGLNDSGLEDMRDVDSRVDDSGVGAEAPDSSAQSAVQSAPSEMRIKSRDELLKELLEE